MASGPEIDVAAAASVPVPRIEHGSNPGMAPAATVKVADVSDAPEMVPVSVPSIMPSPTSMRIGPETLAPVWVAVQEVIRQHSDVSPWTTNLPVHVPARLSVGVADVGVPLSSSPQPTVTRHTLMKRAEITMFGFMKVSIQSATVATRVHPAGNACEVDGASRMRVRSSLLNRQMRA